jgi:aminomethyltransferase
MPVQYPLGVLQEHLHTRQSAGLFDVSHMGQIRVSGLPVDDLAQHLEAIFPADLLSLSANKQVYSLLLNDQGGVVDDLMICRRSSDFMLVVNAGCKDKDFAYLRSLLPNTIALELYTDRALLALQGPQAAEVLQSFGANVDDLFFMDAGELLINGITCWATRSGYTGEDGFELSLDNADVVALADIITGHEAVEVIGLGARDSLRLEAGLCLYGHELDEVTGPIEAALFWSIAKARRLGESRSGGFIASQQILQQQVDGVKRKRVALLADGKAPVREGALLCDEHDVEIGHVVSGGFGPSVKRPIAMAYIDSDKAVIGAKVFAAVRKKKLPLTISKAPFVPSQYRRP